MLLGRGAIAPFWETVLAPAWHDAFKICEMLLLLSIPAARTAEKASPAPVASIVFTGVGLYSFILPGVYMDAPSSPYVRATVSKLCISIKSSTVLVSNN